MGIKGLSRFIKTYIPSAISEKKLSDLANKKIAIDANYFMYKYTISSHDYINKFKKQYEHLISNNINAFYVFDGRPPKEKKIVIERRKEVNKKKNVDVSLDKIKQLKMFFDSKNISYLECESEADFICCKLCENNMIHGCISDDMDFLTLGCNYLYRDYYQHSNCVIEYNRNEILNEFTNEEFIDICIFLGCDYCPRVQDFVNRALEIDVFELFKEQKTLDSVWNYLRDNDMFLFVDDDKEKMVKEKWPKVREIFRNDILIPKNILDIIPNIHFTKYSNYAGMFFIRENFITQDSSKVFYRNPDKGFLQYNNKNYKGVSRLPQHSFRTNDFCSKKVCKEIKKTIETQNKFDALINR